MLVTSNPPASDKTPAELSEADRLAWLRIERALRGMRWWWLFLATLALIIGILASITLVVGIVAELTGDDTPAFILLGSIAVLLCGVAFLPLAFFLGRACFRIFRLRSRKDTELLQHVLHQHRAAWIAMAVCAGAPFVCLATIIAVAAAMRISSHLH